MRSFSSISAVALLWMVTAAHAELRVCNSTIAPVQLALVWINKADAKTTEVPFTTQGWWSTAPGQCSNIDVDGVLMYYRIEGRYDFLGKQLPFSWPLVIAGRENHYQKFATAVKSFKHFSGSGPMTDGVDNAFAKFSAFPLIGKGHWLLLTLRVDDLGGVTEMCKATSEGGAALSFRCDQKAAPRS
jgi:hypothetical protein